MCRAGRLPPPQGNETSPHPREPGCPTSPSSRMLVHSPLSGCLWRPVESLNSHISLAAMRHRSPSPPQSGVRGDGAAQCFHPPPTDNETPLLYPVGSLEAKWGLSFRKYMMRKSFSLHSLKSVLPGNENKDTANKKTIDKYFS